ncbi:ABC transporter substrate-binding protein [Sanguibacter antarcticus]|uniref:Putative spermidine/putrescine transport system substrate-binding protein n=1 Tax=Sanguibacter antarcticus TaxID=372484 RepID=A0A2A9E202_9MICO|nr:ABC transporter substrate-binding protein [Sanguibacter antarcticus]PFG32874.1 putative spermidine/putrescine transport system substrate-binding protein [Sanguibacter antarcticus]
MRSARLIVPTLLLGAAVSGCAAPSAPAGSASETRSWTQITQEATGQTVDLWMYGGDQQGNAYVDDVLTPAAAELGVTLRRVPVADTTDAMTRILAERQAGTQDGAVDLVWVNGDSFATGKQADAWRCGWSSVLPNMTYVAPDDALVTEDFGTSVDGCESPWHKAQFTLVYDSARVPVPPTTIDGVLEWAQANPGRFTYPAPPDFTGSVFVRQVFYSTAGGADQIPAQFDQAAYDALTPGLWDALDDVAPSLWREGRTYPSDSVALDRLYADGEVDMTMTYGPATLTQLVADGTFPATTRVLALDEGTIGNASFLAIPSSAGDPEGAMVVADLALSPEQQAIKADPDTWGQFTVLDTSLLSATDQARFDDLPVSTVVPPYDVLSRDANPELASSWVSRLDDGWRRTVLGSGS